VNASGIGILQEALREQGVGCAFLVPGPNLRYLTGLQLEAFERVILGDGCLVLTAFPRELA
jgi:hypothetical protein